MKQLFLKRIIPFSILFAFLFGVAPQANASQTKVLHASKSATSDGCVGSNELNWEIYGYHVYLDSCNSESVFEAIEGGDYGALDRALEIAFFPETVPGVVIDAFEGVAAAEFEQCVGDGTGCVLVIAWVGGVLWVSDQ